MRVGNAGSMLALALALIAGCGGGGEAPAAEGSAGAMLGAVPPAGADQRENHGQAPGPGVALRLEAPLPGGVLPGFDHSLGSDLTAQSRHTTRTVVLRARGASAREALDDLAGRFTAAGFEAGAVGSGKDSLLQGFWTPGDGRGVMVVDAGGTHVGIVVRDLGPDSKSAREGYSAMVVVTVDSP